MWLWLIGSRKKSASGALPRIFPTQLDPLRGNDIMSSGGLFGRIDRAINSLSHLLRAHHTGPPNDIAFFRYHSRT
jgi:hypothetical protein